MNTQLTPEVKTHVILLKDGSVEYVKEATVMAIAEMHFSELVNLADEAGSFKRSFKKDDIENMMTVASYDKKKNPYGDFDQIQRIIGEWTPDRRIRAIQNMMTGLKRHIAGPNYQGTHAPQELLKKMERSLTFNHNLSDRT